MADMPLDALLEAVGANPALSPAPNIYTFPPTALRAPAIIAEPATPWFSRDEQTRLQTVRERWQVWAVVNANSERAGIEWMRAAVLAVIDEAAKRGILLESTDPPVVREHAGTSYWTTRIGLKAQTEV